MKKIIIFLAFILLALSAFSQGITGFWYGVLDVGSAKLPIILNVIEKNGTYSATVDSPDEGAKGIPTTSVMIENVNFSFTISNIGIAYEGLLQGDSIVGTFRQNEMAFPLNLYAKENLIPTTSSTKPQEPKLPYP